MVISVTLEIRDGIAIITVDNPPVNTLSHAVRAGIYDMVARAQDAADVCAIVLICAGRTFIAGADVRELGKAAFEPILPDVVDAIDASTKPIVAAIHGTALGGGLEVALACRYRITTADAKLGLPEVKLGFIPGARGTQVLPRIVGSARALEMVALGESVSAPRALEIGLIDRITTKAALETEAVAFARMIAGSPRASVRATRPEPLDDAAIDQFRSTHKRKFHQFLAPSAAVRAVRAAAEMPFDDGAKLERQLSLELRNGAQSMALRHVFFAEREVAKVPGLEDATAREIARVGVVGAGTMGVGIATAFLLAGLPVALVDQDETVIKRGVDTVLANIARRLKGDPAAERETASRLHHSTRLTDLANVDLVIEAVFETMDAKRAVFAKIDALARPGAVLATNTSYLDVDAIAQATSRPSDVIGLHFFSPAHIMKLLEVVRGTATAPDVVVTALNLARRLGKTPVMARNTYGFIGNRMLAVRRREADRMVTEGASPYDVDRVAEAFGMPMGPFRISDLSGLDLGWSAETSRSSTIRECLCEAGRRGQKTSAGFYDYEDGRALPSTEAITIIERFATSAGVERRTVSDEEVLARLLWPMIDEGARIVEEGTALRASDIDVVWLNGYGWPAWTGGPMHYAIMTGIDRIVDDMRRLGYAPSDALLRFGKTGPARAALNNNPTLRIAS